MRVATISKHFAFAAAHQLPHHDGPCRNLHGHSYKLEVSVTGRVKAQNGDSDECMVCDFAEIKRVYVEQIEPLVEHKFLNDTLPIPVTTSEYIAMWAHSIFYQALVREDQRLPARDVFVRLWESPTSYAEVGDTPWRSHVHTVFQTQQTAQDPDQPNVSQTGSAERSA